MSCVLSIYDLIHRFIPIACDNPGIIKLPIFEKDQTVQKSMVIVRHFLLSNSALFGLVRNNDPCNPR